MGDLEEGPNDQVDHEQHRIDDADVVKRREPWDTIKCIGNSISRRGKGEGGGGTGEEEEELRRLREDGGKRRIARNQHAAHSEALGHHPIDRI